MWVHCPGAARSACQGKMIGMTQTGPSAVIILTVEFKWPPTMRDRFYPRLPVAALSIVPVLVSGCCPGNGDHRDAPAAALPSALRQTKRGRSEQPGPRAGGHGGFFA